MEFTAGLSLRASIFQSLHLIYYSAILSKNQLGSLYRALKTFPPSAPISRTVHQSQQSQDIGYWVGAAECQY